MATIGELLDNTPLRFGKYKGKTPEEVAFIDTQYVIWMYENVTNFPTCSKALYEDCKTENNTAEDSGYDGDR